MQIPHPMDDFWLGMLVWETEVAMCSISLRLSMITNRCCSSSDDFWFQRNSTIRISRNDSKILAVNIDVLGACLEVKRAGRNTLKKTKEWPSIF